MNWTEQSHQTEELPWARGLKETDLNRKKTNNEHTSQKKKTM